jgi:hypothetical protein
VDDTPAAASPETRSEPVLSRAARSDLEALRVATGGATGAPKADGIEAFAIVPLG